MILGGLMILNVDNLYPYQGFVKPKKFVCGTNLPPPALLAFLWKYGMYIVACEYGPGASGNLFSLRFQ